MKNFTKPVLLSCLMVFAGFQCIHGQVSNSKYIQVAYSNSFFCNPAEEVKFGGTLHERMMLIQENRLIAQDMDQIIEPFRHRNESKWWQTEFWGKWMLSAAKAYEYSGDPVLFQKMKESTQEIIESQSENGYIGNYAPEHHLEQWDVWGRKYTLLGLLYYYDLSGDTEALHAAERLADHLMTEIGPGKTDVVKTGNYRGMASSSVLEPIVLLYERTGNKKYLEFALYIVKQWETADGPRLISKALEGVPVAERFPVKNVWWGWENGQKAYEMMSCYDGLLRLFQHTGNQEYFDAAYKAAVNILEEEINIVGSGATMECWYHGKERQTVPTMHTMETCVTITWMKLCYEIYRLTGELRWMEEIEKSTYNNLLGSLMPDGSRFSKYSGLQGFRDHDGFQCDMEINCCMANGPRGLFLLPDAAVTRNGKNIYMNLYNPSEAQLVLEDGTAVKLHCTGNYPESGHIEIQIRTSVESDLKLYLRIPGWSNDTKISINGSSTEGVIEPGTYHAIERRWQSGDMIRIELDMRGRLIERKEGIRTFHALATGPIVLARDSRFGDLDVDAELTFPEAEHGRVILEPCSGTGAWIALTAKVNYGSGENPVEMTLPFIDFSSAGNLWDPGNRYRVWIPAIYNPIGELHIE
ncbi:MAG: beta-L-arabinofuranosidase domain-containing protein [Bacteroidota bacterium]